MKINLIQLGFGNVGRELCRQVLSQGPKTELVYCGLFTSSQGLFQANGLTAKEIATFPNGNNRNSMQAIDRVPAPFIVIDVTASESTLPQLKQALKRGGGVVTSNKKPLAGSPSDYLELMNLGGDRLFYEATVGAGLPIISTLGDLLSTGDEIENVSGCFSGTLGYIFSQMQSGSLFSDAVRRAKAQGLTEPDPREDLSGTDVGRKAVILARMLGCELELGDVALPALFPADLKELSPEDFMNAVSQLDSSYADKIHRAEATGKVLRYVAEVTGSSVRVQLKAVPAHSDIGQLAGPDNIIVIQTKRYHENPLVIKGPGAGVSVTAAGVFADVIRAGNRAGIVKPAPAARALA